MENTISVDDKKPILNSKEKRRFSQISEQFFKGSHEFFVEQQLKTQKFINEKLKKSSFYEHYQDAIQNVKDNINNKIDVVKNNLKKDLGSKIMNFIIVLEIGVIAAAKCPFNLQNVKRIIINSSNNIINFFSSNNFSFEEFLDITGIKINKYTYFEDFLKIIQNILKENIYIFAGGINYFLNNSEYNAFIICLGQCALKIGEAAGGAVGIIFNIVDSIAGREITKKPELQHFLGLGRRQHQAASSMELSTHNIIGRHSIMTLTSNVVGVLDRSSGTRNKPEIRYLVNENGELEEQSNVYNTNWLHGIGLMQNISHNLGVTAHNDEEDDFKRRAGDLQNFRVAASRESITRLVRLNDTSSSILQTESYRQLVQRWGQLNNIGRRDENGNVIGVLYDAENLSKGKFEDLVLDERVILTNPNTSEDFIEFKAQQIVIRNFYDRYRYSYNSLTRSICDEIKQWLFSTSNIAPVANVLFGQYEGFFPVKYFIFIPPIAYAIWQFEHVQKLNQFAHENIDYNLYQMEINIRGNRDTAALRRLRNLKRVYDSGLSGRYMGIGFDSYFYELKNILDLALENNFENVKKLRPDIILPAFQNFAFIVNVITKPFDTLKVINNLYNNWFFRGENNTLNEDIAIFFSGTDGTNTIYNITSSSANIISTFDNNSIVSTTQQTQNEQSITTQSTVSDRNMYLWRKLEDTLSDISESSAKRRRDIKVLMSNRLALWDSLNEASIYIQDDNLYPGNTIQRPTT